MALSARPPKSPAAPAPAAKVEQFISKGGTVAVEPNAAGKGAQHPLKFPDTNLFERLERTRKAGAVPLPRNTWILQAIAEKLDRDGA